MKLLTTLLLTAIFFSGCGYTSPYAPPTETDGKGDRIPLYLEMWDDETNLLGYQAVIQRSLIHWLKKSKNFGLVKNSSEASHILSGTIHSADFPGLSYGTFDRAVELRAKVRFSYKIEEMKNNLIKLEKKEFTKLKSYLVGSSAVETEDNRQRVLQEIADDLAEEIYIELSYILIPKKEGV
jgi:hypothetical protein